jgi:hypothetical protein
MQHRLLSILLLLLFTLPFAMKVGVLAHWKINQVRIIKLYCINKNKPRLHCDGKCYLAQQLKRIEAQQLQKVRNAEHPLVPIEKLAKTDFSPFILIGVPFLLEHHSSLACAFVRTTEPLRYAFFYDFETIKNCFQPPEMA